MIKRVYRALVVASVAAGCLTGVSQLSAAPRFIEYSAEQLTKQAKTRFPQQRCAGGIVCVVLSEPQVRMPLGQSRLLIQARASPTMGNQAFQMGTVEVGGRPEYQSEQGAFYLKEPVVTKFDFPGLTPESAAIVASVLRSVIAEGLASTPVWTLDDTDPQQAMMRIVLQSVAVADGKFRVTVGR